MEKDQDGSWKTDDLKKVLRDKKVVVRSCFLDLSCTAGKMGFSFVCQMLLFIYAAVGLANTKRVKEVGFTIIESIQYSLNPSGKESRPVDTFLHEFPTLTFQERTFWMAACLLQLYTAAEFGELGADGNEDLLFYAYLRVEKPKQVLVNGEGEP